MRIGRFRVFIRLRCNFFCPRLLGFISCCVSCLPAAFLSLFCLPACCLRFSVLFVSCRLSVLCRFSSALSVRLFDLYRERLFSSPSTVMSLSPIMWTLGLFFRPYPMTFCLLVISVFLYSVLGGLVPFPAVVRLGWGFSPCLVPPPCW